MNNSDETYISESLVSVVDRIDDAFHKGNYCTGIKTGFDSLDRITCGLNKGELIVIGGRPSTGKTILATKILEYICLVYEAPSLLFNLEMTVEVTTERILSSLARIDMSKIRNGSLDSGDWSSLTSAISMLANKKLKIRSGPVTIEQIVAISREFKVEHPDMGVIVIDPIHLIECEERQNVHEKLASVTRTLKNLALELKVPIIITSALNRNLELRTNRRPLLNDLRGSGAMEDDADIVFMIYRPQVYDRHSTEPCELIIAKNRSGPVDTIYLHSSTNYPWFYQIPPD
jgi:replicative DNA helicase